MEIKPLNDWQIDDPLVAAESPMKIQVGKVATVVFRERPEAAENRLDGRARSAH